MTGKSGEGTARQTVRIPEDEWDEFGRGCAALGDNVNPSSYLLNVVRWAIGRPGAEPPVQLPAVLPPGVTVRVEGRTWRAPNGRTVYSITAKAPIEDVTAAIGDAMTLAPDPAGTTLVEVAGDYRALSQARALLAVAGIEVTDALSELPGGIKEITEGVSRMTPHGITKFVIRVVLKKDVKQEDVFDVLVSSGLTQGCIFTEEPKSVEISNPSRSAALRIYAALLAAQLDIVDFS